MKYICFGYTDESMWERMAEGDRRNFFDRCFSYDDELRRGGHIVAGEGLEQSRNAATLRWRDGAVAVTDGPYAETKEQIGGILIIDASDLTHAIRLMSKHPSLPLGGGCWEIRPLADMTEAVAESEERRTMRNGGDRA